MQCLCCCTAFAQMHHLRAVLSCKLSMQGQEWLLVGCGVSHWWRVKGFSNTGLTVCKERMIIVYRVCGLHPFTVCWVHCAFVYRVCSVYPFTVVRVHYAMYRCTVSTLSQLLGYTADFSLPLIGYTECGVMAIATATSCDGLAVKSGNVSTAAKITCTMAVGIKWT